MGQTNGADDAPLRLTMTLPGSASLGAFQAGAVAALSEVLYELRERDQAVSVAAIGGASAGSIVGLLFVHALMTGRDVTSLMFDAWVDNIDVDLLRSEDASAPLGFERLRSEMRSFLEDTEEHPYDARPRLEEGAGLHISLTSLLGFETMVESEVSDSSKSSSLSFADWISFGLEPGHEPSTLFEPEGGSMIDAVLVSAAHPLAFAPRSLDRSPDRDAYEERGITNFPPEGVLWYSDGGLVESEPIGSILRSAREAAGSSPSRWLHFVVDPRSSGPSSGEDWAASDGNHSWLGGLRRAISIVPSQSLQDDIRRIGEINDRLLAVDQAVDEWSRRCGLDESETDELRNDLLSAAGLDGEEVVDLHVISPLLVASDRDDSVDDLLAGDVIGAFGGFLEQEIRRSDFALGWRSTSAWVRNDLASLVSDEAMVDHILERLDRSCPVDGAEPGRTSGVDQLGWKARGRLALVAARAGRILVGEAVDATSIFGGDDE